MPCSDFHCSLLRQRIFLKMIASDWTFLIQVPLIEETESLLPCVRFRVTVVIITKINSRNTLIRFPSHLLSISLRTNDIKT